ncbi:lipopolysaccharide biosynthesis protein [Fibrobacter sp.]|uniref:lipopolysaccharide biosynthesis protein n=1 Tax=Fibrobacter sp. TaxID=35828 RepID=UPI00386FA217
MSSIKQQTISGSKWNFLERVAAQGIQFIIGIVLARLLLPTDFGTVGLLAIFFEISQAFIDSGFNSALIRTKNPTQKDYSTVFYFNLLISVAVYAILFFAAPCIATFFNIPILCPILRVQAVTLIINAAMAVQVSMLNIRLDFRSLAKRRIWATLIGGVCGVILAYKGFGVWALVYQQIISAIINLVFICYICRWIPKAGFSSESFKRLGSFGSRLLAAGLLHTLYRNLTTFAIGKFYSAKDLGFYTRGASIADLPGSTINGVLQTVTYPILAKIQDDETQLVRIYRKYIRITSLGIFIVSGILCALAEPFILLVFTDKWADSVIYLHIFAFSYMFDHLSTINLNLLKVKGRSDLFLKLEIIKKSISITLILLAIPHGVLAICLAKFIYNQIAVFINTYYTGKLFHLGYIQQVKDFAPYLIRCVLACTPAYFITYLGLPHIVTLMLGSAVALMLYWIMLRKNPDMLELVDLLKEKFKKKK